jgi:nitrogen fixation protein FixH
MQVVTKVVHATKTVVKLKQLKVLSLYQLLKKVQRNMYLTSQQLNTLLKQAEKQATLNTATAVVTKQAVLY